MSDTMMPRRRFLGAAAAATAAGAAGVATGVNPFAGLQAAAAQGTAPRQARRGQGGYGRLVAKRPARTPDFSPEYGGVYADPQAEWLALPEDFDYVVLGIAGTTMSDGNRTPQAHDGMGAFAAQGGRVRLVRNHENRNGAGDGLPPIGGPTNAYDPLAAGGNSTLEIDFDGGVPVLGQDFVSLNGTIVNCAGGVTPWGSWLSSEETTETRGEIPHGYNFEVPSANDSAVEPVPLTAMGRFSHEAVCVDPRTGIVYETEDAGDSGFFRFVPDRSGRLDSGRLQMLKVRGATNYDTRTGQDPRQALRVEWVDIDDPDPAGGGQKAVYDQGFARGGAIFRRLEGCWFGFGAVYFNATNGGDAGHGQIWEYRPGGRSGGTLKLIYETPDPEILTFPDNINVTPRGGLVLCEDT
ncbi:MAG TPA: alkaline phosphatase PhoX, partial [Acidimicrobiales bacterium]|nr:alkaline phosphatase PhoX [Acidimicrobiales bacterium]